MKRKFLLGMLSAMFLSTSLLAGKNAPSSPPGDSWIQKADFTSARYYMFSFSIGNKGYAGTGIDNSSTIYNDFWEYDPAANAWTQKADCGGGIRYSAAGFSIGNKGYAGTGVSGSYQWKKDMWEYDPATNSWMAIADFAGGFRYSMIGFGIGNKGYMGTGNYRESPWVLATYYNDFWEYDPATDVWTRKADVPELGRCGAVGISTGGKGYIGCGYYYYDTRKNDWWQYDPATDVWTRKADLPATPRVDANAFTIGNKAFVSGGWYYSPLADMWEYDTNTDTWTERTYAPLGAKSKAITFTIGDKAYLGAGYDNTGGTNDFWEYTMAAEPISPVAICDQTWMQKNLSLSNYRNGDPIPYVPDATEWNSLTTGAWCYYNNDPSTEAIYGKLYNWYAVSDPRGLAPDGWHIPGYNEWIALENCAGGYFVSGGSLKEVGTTHWTDPNTGATNSTGFTALPGGMRNGGGGFSLAADAGFWWSSSAGQFSHYGIMTEGGYYRYLFHGNTIFYGNGTYETYPFPPISESRSGMSVRCVKDVAPSFTSCPSNQKIYTTTTTCNNLLNYTVATTGIPGPTISYSFTGATIASGSGTGSGQTFNLGITNVTVTATSSAGTATCGFNVEVLDNTPPAVQCPAAQNLCYRPDNTYTIPQLTATDNCSIQTIQYAITGATSRSGTGVNASGLFNPGMSSIKWKVTDASGNVSECTSAVNIKPRFTVSIPDTYPLLVWGKANTVFIGFGPTCAPLIALPSGGTPYSGLNPYRYSWSNGGNLIATMACPPSVPGSYTFTVTVTDAAGCTATASKTIYVVDVRCGPRNNEVLICWYGRSQSCYQQWQAVLALSLGAQVGLCNTYTATQVQKQNNAKEILISPDNKITVFPNPSGQYFTLSIQSVKTEQLQVRIFDAFGQMIEQLKGSANKTYTFGHQYKPGIYMVEVQQGIEKHTFKLIKL